jgi:hypothetical protein
MMQIDRISKVPASMTGWETIEPQSKPKVSSSSTTAAQAIPASSSIPGAGAVSSSPSIPNEFSTTGLQVTTLAGTYSTTVSGKSYAESVEKSGGVYVASVPSPPGIRASGPSVEAAENNLDMKLDTLA